MKKVVLALFFILNVANAENIKVAVAANMTATIEEIKREFLKENSKDSIDFIIGSSGKLAAQIVRNAPYSLFLSADMETPQKLYEQKLAINAPKIYAKGTLVMFSTKDDLNLKSGLDILKSKKVSKIAIANPKTATYGKASIESFKKSGIYKEIKSKLVYAESITQTVQFATTAADIGFIALSAVKDEKMSRYIEGKNWVAVEKSLYTPINQGVVITKNGENSKLAKKFYEFLFSPKAKEIFVKFGYIVD